MIIGGGTSGTPEPADLSRDEQESAPTGSDANVAACRGRSRRLGDWWAGRRHNILRIWAIGLLAIVGTALLVTFFDLPPALSVVVLVGITIPIVVPGRRRQLPARRRRTRNDDC